jgi:peptide/nickel transport system ATP-binding protein
MMTTTERPAAEATPETRQAADQPVLSVEDLRTVFRTEEGELAAVDGVSFHLDRREVVSIVGESGCGKSMTSLSIMRLLPAGARPSGSVLFRGRDLLGLEEGAMRHIRGSEISMIFQEPMTSLNPVLTVGEQIAESVMLHKRVGGRVALDRAEEMLSLVGIPEPRQRLGEYPHQLSGGMRQRVMIAIALACDPALLIADEPTTALDVTIQAQIIELLVELRHRLDTTILLITHDLGVVAELADRVLVMYAGRIVEEGTTLEIFDDPRHPYTRGLMQAIPRLVADPAPEKARLAEIPGTVPALSDLPDGCRFAPRCLFARPRCREAYPETFAACWEHDALPPWASEDTL